jgi:hypothetical protein
MKHVNKKSLRLLGETIRALGRDRLDGVFGGLAKESTFQYSCNGSCPCSDQ